jgi:hypothetical protein
MGEIPEYREDREYRLELESPEQVQGDGDGFRRCIGRPQRRGAVSTEAAGYRILGSATGAADKVECNKPGGMRLLPCQTVSELRSD